MPQALKRNALIVFGLAILFWWSFTFARPVAAEKYAFLEYEKTREKAEEEGDVAPVRPKLADDSSSFVRKFEEVIEEETVPEGFRLAWATTNLKRK